MTAELAFQKQLAKQLGLKGKTKTKAKGPDDNLDDFLKGSTSRTGQFIPHMGSQKLFSGCSI